MKSSIIPLSRIQNYILFIRKEKVMLDRDLALLYGVQTKRLNEQVRRNIERFPKDFMFQLTKKEKAEVVANCDHLEALKYSKTNPFAFTEHGAIMLASVLNSEIAINASLAVVRAFIHLRSLIAGNKELARQIEELEKNYDEKFNLVFATLRKLMDQPPTKRRPIGFKKGK